MTKKKDTDNRQININDGNYAESIGRDYVHINAYYNSSRKEAVFPTVCKNQEGLTEYLENITNKLKQKFGFIEFTQNIIDGNNTIRFLARKANFDMSVGLIPMRGEAFLIFSEFAEMNFAALKAYSNQCLNYAKTQANYSTVGNAFYNFKIPNNLCFAVAIVDEIDDQTRKNVQKINPLRDKLDALWYEIPIIYELNNQELYFYEKPLDWKDMFTGEIAWKEIREIIQQSLLLKG